MYLGQRVLIKHNGKIVEGSVIEIYFEDLDIRLDNEEIVRCNFWSVRKVEYKNEE